MGLNEPDIMELFTKDTRKRGPCGVKEKHGEEVPKHIHITTPFPSGSTNDFVLVASKGCMHLFVDHIVTPTLTF